MKSPSYYLNKPIESLQTMLREISKQDQSVLPVIPDGYFGRSTYASVLSFQKSNKLPQSGIVSTDTWSAIEKNYESIYTNNAPVIADLAWKINHTVFPQESNYHVFLVQGLLGALSLIFGDLKKPELNGVLDHKTQAGLQWIQHASGMEPTGNLDTQTWHYLIQLYRTVVGDGSSFII